MATRSELVGDASYMHLREVELMRQSKELKSENSRLKEQLEILSQEFRQFKQDMYDEKIGRSPKQVKDTATSPLNLPLFTGASLPVGSRPAAIDYGGRKEDAQQHIPPQQERGPLPTAGILCRREGGNG